MTTTADLRIALMSALNTPPYDDAAGTYSTPLREAARLLDAYWAAVLREVAAEIESIDAHPNATGRHADIYKALAHRFRRQADTITDESEAQDG